MTYALTIILMLHSPPAPTGAGRAPAVQEHPAAAIRRLIEELGSRRFTTRQQATLRLKRLGRSAIPALRAAQGSENPEIRTRATSVLEHILGTAARDAFLKSPTLTTARDVAVWKRLRRLSGSDEKSVQNLERYMRAEPRLFAAHSLGAEEFAVTLTERVGRLMDYSIRERTSPPINDSVEAILFLATDPDVPLSPAARLAAETVFGLAQVQRGLSGKSPSAMLRRLAGEWIRQPGSQYQKLLLTLKFDLPEGLQLARDTVQAGARGARLEYALHIIGKLGEPQDARILESLLDDQTPLSGGRVAAVRSPDGGRRASRFESRVGDVALGMLWHLRGENPADHGFDRTRVVSHPWFVYRLGSLGFLSDDQRAAALREWKEFAAHTGGPDANQQSESSSPS